MRVAVLGAGVVGISTAYELWKDGHEVTVIDRNRQAASETSYANAGLIAPGHSYTWASPKVPKILLKSLFDDRQALRFRLSADPKLWSWTLKFLKNCTAARSRINTKRKVGLCQYSQQLLDDVSAATDISYNHLSGGLLYLYRSTASFDKGVMNTAILAEEGLDLQTLSSNEAIKIDPALAPVKDKIAGAIYCPSDASGDARLFTRTLADYLKARGVTFRYESTVTGFKMRDDKVAAVKLDVEELEADAVILCLGVYSPVFARQLRVSLPIYPVKGYSVTLPLKDHNNAPTIGGVDEDNLVAYARFGDQMRVTATADFAGYDTSHTPADFHTMMAAIAELFPDAADYAMPDYWAGLRPMTPEGTPIFGRGHYRNMWFNVGHGHMGWTMASGSARIVADLLQGKNPEISLDGMLVKS